MTSTPDTTSTKPKMAERFVGWILRRPYFALPLGLLIVAAAMSGFPNIKANFTHTAFFKSGDPLLTEFNRFERQFGNDDAVAIVVHSPSGMFDMDSATLLAEMTEAAWLLPEVIRVDSLANFSWVHAFEDDIEVEPLLPDDIPITQEILDERSQVALGHETIPDYLISKDGKTALIYARIKPGFETPPDAQKIVGAAREMIKDMKRTDHEIFMTGGPVINFSFKESTTQDSKTLMPLVLGAAILFLILLLRTVSGVVLPLIVMGLSVGSAIAFAGHLGIELTSVTSMLPFIMIAVAVADSVHVLSSFVGARRRGVEKLDAAAYALKKNVVPTILTSISTAAGFFSFASSDLKPVLGVGILAGVGTIMAWFITFLIMGPLMIWFPSKIKPTGKKEDLKAVTPAMKRYTAWLFRHRWKIIGGYAVVCIAAITASAYNVVNADPYKYFAKNYPLRQANDFIIDNLSGTAIFEMRIQALEEDGIKEPEFLGKVEAFEKKIVEIEGVTKTVSIVDILRQTNRSLNGGLQAEYKLPDSKEAIAQELFLYTMSLPQGMDVNNIITVKNDAIRVTVISSVTDSASWVKTADRFEAIGKDLGLNVKVTGKTMLYQSMNDYVVRSFVQSIIIAVFLVSLILIVAFRSLRLGLLAMLPNLIPLIVGGAVLKILDRPLDIGTVLVCSVCLGIAVDDTIHVLTNYLRNRTEGKSASEAVGRVLSHTAPALIVTTAVLVASFGVLGLGTFVPNVYFGIMTAVILTTALVTDLTFLPAMLLIRASLSEKKEQEQSLPKATAREESRV